MGVSGSGKTTVGHALADELRWRFADADDYHSRENIARMSAGIPLTDEERQPWLQSLHQAIVGWIAAGENVVLACSALKASYRALLVVGPEVKVVYLHSTPALIAARMAARSHHFMNPDLLRSQFETLEEPQGSLIIDASLPVTQIVLKIHSALSM